LANDPSLTGFAAAAVLCQWAMNDRPYWQFRLSHLFYLTTLSAVAAAIAVAFGPGSLLISNGLIVAWLNWCGALEPLQRGQRQMILLGLAWNVFLVSLALPSVHVFGPVAGWGAAWWAFIGPLEEIRKGEIQKPALLWYLGINLANALIVLLPLLMWRLRRGGGQWLSAALCLAMIFPWSVGWQTSMLPGYYVWCAGFYLALLALPIRTNTLAGMAVLAAVMGVASEWNYLLASN